MPPSRYWLNSITFLLCAGIMVQVSGDFLPRIQMEGYSNPSNRLSNGSCCSDPITPMSDCTVSCLEETTVCFRSIDHPVDDTESCPLLERSGIRPLPPRGLLLLDVIGAWPGEVQLLVTITDTLSGGLVDVIIANITQAVSSPATVQSHEGIHGVATFNFGITVVCLGNFCGLDCNTVCVGRNDSSGHFTCDVLECVVCLPGYQNESSNCTDCALREGCSDDGGFCEEPGECQCRDGYLGLNCNITAVSTTINIPATSMMSLITPSESAITMTSFITPSESGITRTSESAMISPTPTESLVIPLTSDQSQSILLTTSLESPDISVTTTATSVTITSIPDSTSTSVPTSLVPTSSQSTGTTSAGETTDTPTKRTTAMITSPVQTPSSTTASPLSSRVVIPPESGGLMPAAIAGLTIGMILLAILILVILLVVFIVLLIFVTKRRHKRRKNFWYVTANSGVASQANTLQESLEERANSYSLNGVMQRHNGIDASQELEIKSISRDGNWFQEPDFSSSNAVLSFESHDDWESDTSYETLSRRSADADSNKVVYSEISQGKGDEEEMGKEGSTRYGSNPLEVF